MELKTGLYPDIPFSEYLDIDAVSNSYLGKFKECPAKALVEDKDSPEKFFGRAFHAYTLEPSSFFLLYAVAPSADKRTKAGKKELAEFEKANEGKTIISAEDFQIIGEMEAAVYNHPTARHLLEQGGVSEATALWQDEETGLWIKARPDRIPASTGETLIDIKTAKSVEAPIFLKEVWYKGYARGAALYQEGISFATGKIFDIYTFIAVEKLPPYRTEVYTLTRDLLGAGYDEFHMLLRQVKKCKDSGIYPHYKHAGACDLDRPAYAVIDQIG